MQNCIGDGCRRLLLSACVDFCVQYSSTVDVPNKCYATDHDSFNIDTGKCHADLQPSRSPVAQDAGMPDHSLF